MGPTLLAALALLVMVGALLLVPFGIPGLWIMVAIVLVATMADAVAWPTFALLVGLAAGAELAELGLMRWLGSRYGGSGRAFWGAVAGGFAGLFAGFPVPVAGPLLAGFVGTFVGAGLVTWLETRSLRRAGRVGWGVLLARTGAVGVKVAVGFLLLAVTAAAFFF